jgi:putative ABC transport system permease protein
MLCDLYIRLRSLFRRASVESELNEELRFHRDRQVEKYIQSGLTYEEAIRRFRLEFGGFDQVKEDCRETRGVTFLETLAQDIRYTLRTFRRNPVFTVTVIVTLAVGIGATTAVFSVVDRILFRSLPYAHDDRIVSVGLVQSLERQEFTLGGFFYEWRDNQKPFEAFATQEALPHACDLVETNPAQLNCIHAQAGFLPMLGISPVPGWNFLQEEDRPNGPRVALISYSLW